MARIGWSELLAYWQSLRTGTAPPPRARFDPVVAAPRLVAHLTLYGVEPSDYRVRVVGSEVVPWIHAPQAGLLLLAEATPSVLLREALAAALTRTVAMREPFLVRYLARYDEPVCWTSLYLPLVEGDAVAAIVAGTFHERGTPAGALETLRADPDDGAWRNCGTRPGI